MDPLDLSLEELYGLEKHEVDLTRVQAPSGRWLETFPSPGPVLVNLFFPEFTCLCPKTSQPDFAEITVKYIPKDVCVELKSLKYYLNSFRCEGTFHEAVIILIEKDLRTILQPRRLTITGEFDVRGGIYPTIWAGDYPVGDE